MGSDKLEGKKVNRRVIMEETRKRDTVNRINCRISLINLELAILRTRIKLAETENNKREL